jgi:aminoglycoside phosphotransferase family enzyme/predicted kinase
MDRPEDYPHAVDGKIEVHETHISRVTLAGPYAYKRKKEIRNSFLDYSTLQLRKQACEEELRLGRRYADDLYLRVVSIHLVGGRLVVEGDGPTVDYAVQMKRFDQHEILSHRLEQQTISDRDIHEIASTTAQFHRKAAVFQGAFDDFFQTTLAFAIDNLNVIRQASYPSRENSIDRIENWTRSEWHRLIPTIRIRYESGKVRECHGDLHCGNIVRWSDRWTLFDGIEFNPDLTRIDCIDDAAFLMMDLQARGRCDLASLWINAYLEETDDYEGLPVLSWYAVYRAMVRAKVASIRHRQFEKEGDGRSSQTSLGELDRYTGMAIERTAIERTGPSATPELWITHGLSGSGKSTRSLEIVKSHRAIRIRSDVQRLRLFGPGHHDASATQATYHRLLQLADAVLRSGYTTIVDATFLAKEQRTRFRRLAEDCDVPYRILACTADEGTLRQRIANRLAQGSDPSEADGSVLEKQMQSCEALTQDELPFVVPFHP